MMKNSFGKFVGWLVLMSFVLALPMRAFAAPVVSSAPQTVTGGSEVAGVPATPDGKVEINGWKSKALKLAVKALAKSLRSKLIHKVISWLEKNASKKIATLVGRHALVIAAVCDRLVYYEQLTMQIVRDQIAGGLYDVGVPLGAAREVAFWIAEVLSWILL